MATKHTIILIQHTGSFDTRSYLDFQSVNSAMDGVVKLYEHKLKQLNPTVPNITYDISDLNNYLDSLYDLSALAFNNNTNTYEPHSKEWIKTKILQGLQRQAA